MAVFSSVQVFLVSMLLGVYIFDYRLGSNPFTVLLREHPDFIGLPMFRNPDYLQNLDGRGLNPLLQNYWMTIHPPTLFLGFASTLIPFSYAMSGMLLRKYREWISPCLPWAYFSILVLGAGILMGGVWAYEALSFGGFWAWDPVENASLVPWITLVGAAHLMILNRNGKLSLLSMYLLTALTFVLVLYSTFLTRSGILGEASVHSFTDLGMSGQLLAYLLFYLVLAFALIFYSARFFEKPKGEEEWLSREFWVFVGSLILFLSAFQITISTSIPVINKIFGSRLAPPSDAISHYNGWQMPLAILVLLIMGFAQFLKYSKTPRRQFWSNTGISALAATIITIPIVFLLKLYHPFHLSLLFAGIFSLSGNAYYWVRILKGKLPYAGGAISHIGFGLLIIGALISMAGQKKISRNVSIYDVAQLGDNFKNNENILLMKGDTLQMGKYYVTYTGKEKEGVNLYFNVHYLTRNADGTMQSEFALKPRVQLNPRMGNVAEPDTRHFIDRDIYTHVTWAMLEDEPEENEYGEPEKIEIKPGDTLFKSASFMVFDSLFRVSDMASIGLTNRDLAVGMPVYLYDLNSGKQTLKPMFIMRDTSEVISIPAENEAAGIKILINTINPNKGTVEIQLSERKSLQKDFIVMQAVLFPFINLLWLGCTIMLIGIGISIYYRIKFNLK
jgi:cytochrome c-type biogenesis protein CcmF